MTNRKAKPAQTDRGVPEKPRFYVREAARIVSERLEINEQTAISRLYRRIGDGTIQAHRYLGVVMIPREEVLRILKGEPV